MAQSALEAANAALFKLGAASVTSVSADTSKEGVAIAARLDICKRSLLRMHPWNFATKRSIITPPASVTLTTPYAAYTATNKITYTVASHSFSAGDYLTAASSGSTESDGVFEVSSTTATTVVVNAPGVTSLSGTPAAGTIRLSPAFDYTYLYTLPTDCLRLLKINDQDDWTALWRVEGRKILSDIATSMKVKFIYDVTDYTLMDVEFYECLATYIAWDICDYITGSESKKRDLWTDLHGGDGKIGMLPRGRFADATEDSQQLMDSSSWTNAHGFAATTVVANTLG